MVEEHQEEGGDPVLNGLGVPAVVLFVLPSPNSCDLPFSNSSPLMGREQVPILILFHMEL
jgi:hypothetical protein